MMHWCDITFILEHVHRNSETLQDSIQFIVWKNLPFLKEYNVQNGGIVYKAKVVKAIKAMRRVIYL